MAQLGSRPLIFTSCSLSPSFRVDLHFLLRHDGARSCCEHSEGDREREEPFGALCFSKTELLLSDP